MIFLLDSYIGQAPTFAAYELYGLGNEKIRLWHCVGHVFWFWSGKQEDCFINHSLLNSLLKSLVYNTMLLDIWACM